jgi:uncharacterized protein (TIGR02246 family)
MAGSNGIGIFAINRSSSSAMSKTIFRRICIPICIASALSIAHGASAQSPGASTRDESGIRQAGKDYLAAAERGDVKALADFWTADGIYTDASGRTTKARDLLGKSASHLRHQPTTVSHVSVHFITDDVAVEDADCEMSGANGSPPVTGHYTALWVRQNGRWKLDSLRETRTSSAANPSEELASLAPFVGEWTGQIDQSTIHISAKWDATKKFLRREFSVTSGKAPLAGTQEIGWDSLTGHIKSWAFLDDGSHGEGLWSLEGTVWLEVSSRVLPDGRIIKATQTYKFPDKNTLIWKLIRGSVDGKPAQTMEVTLKRS